MLLASLHIWSVPMIMQVKPLFPSRKVRMLPSPSKRTTAAPLAMAVGAVDSAPVMYLASEVCSFCAVARSARKDTPRMMIFAPGNVPPQESHDDSHSAGILHPLTGPKHENRALPFAKHGEEIQQLLPREVLFVQQLHAMFGFGARKNRGSRRSPLAFPFTSHLASGNFHVFLVANALQFSCITDGVHVELRVIRMELR